MSRKLIIFFTPLLLVIGLFSCDSQPAGQMIFPEGLERINSDLLAKKVNLKIENKLVFYLDISERSLHLFSSDMTNWGDFAVQHPDLSVLIYLSGNDQKGQRTKEKMEEYLKFNHFPYEVFLDPEYQLYNLNKLDSIPYENKTLQVYYVKGNQILGPSNFGIPKIRDEELERFFGEE